MNIIGKTCLNRFVRTGHQAMKSTNLLKNPHLFTPPSKNFSILPGRVKVDANVPSKWRRNIKLVVVGGLTATVISNMNVDPLNTTIYDCAKSIPPAIKVTLTRYKDFAAPAFCQLKTFLYPIAAPTLNSPIAQYVIPVFARIVSATTNAIAKIIDVSMETFTADIKKETTITIANATKTEEEARLVTLETTNKIAEADKDIAEQKGINLELKQKKLEVEIDKKKAELALLKNKITESTKIAETKKNHIVQSMANLKTLQDQVELATASGNDQENMLQQLTIQIDKENANEKLLQSEYDTLIQDINTMKADEKKSEDFLAQNPSPRIYNTEAMNVDYNTEAMNVDTEIDSSTMAENENLSETYNTEAVSVETEIDNSTMAENEKLPEIQANKANKSTSNKPYVLLGAI